MARNFAAGRFSKSVHTRIQRGTGGPDPAPENHKNIGFLSNTGTDPLKNHKAAKPVYNVGPSSARQRNAEDGPLLVLFGINEHYMYL